MDPGSRQRARAAAALCRQLEIPCTRERQEIAAQQGGRSLEAAAREIRYAFLERVRRAQGARFVATAHHLDDQAETVILRMLFGSGLEGLSGIRCHHEAVIRPFLEVPRARLRRALSALAVDAQSDPANDDPRIVRNRVRHLLIPGLCQETGITNSDLARLARRSQGAFRRVESLLLRHLQPEATGDGVSIRRCDFTGLPAGLQPSALALLHRMAGAPYPAAATARRELQRQLRTAHRIGCDCGGGWRWVGQRGKLVLRRVARQHP